MALPSTYGKPRPGLIIQSDLFHIHPSFTVLPLTSELRDAPLFRIRVEPDEVNRLSSISQIMIDKAHTISCEKAGKVFGRLSDEIMLEVNRALAVFLGFS